MIIRNYLNAEYKFGSSHKGNGEVKSVRLYDNQDFDTALRFFYYTEIPPQASIGYHTHGQDEEVYVIMEGRGRMTVNGEVREVGPGDVLLNKPGWSHGLENHTDAPLRLLVFEAALPAVE
ncbi:cupin domain-containing protein [Paenibacillus silviterrae]|uniref:cupin domain-containing protein n=1 Tax=Paenibacillus silviterrae TaxID=3242194 RepID=UPI0025428559|nr:cupin domain-containing protein [Paenibacillus chinjuensis]